MQLILTRRVSRDTNAVPDDIKILKKALNRLGYYMPDSKHGITKIADGDMIDALKRFQNDHALTSDGIMLPGDDTMLAINKVLADQEGKVKLVWHCASDQSSCAACRARNGTVVDDASENTPNCKGNCRCWVTPLADEIAKIDDPRIESVYPEAIIFPVLRGEKIISIGKNLIDRFTKPSRLEMDITKPQLQKKFKHAKDFGINGNANSKTLEEFKSALIKHIEHSDTKVIRGTYHGVKVTHHINFKTRIDVIRNEAGEFVSSWKLSDKQFAHIMRDGKLGGGK